jgi:hypothetical protein
MTIRDESNRAGIVEGLNEAIRENPLAAGLIGAGLAWMLLGGPKGFGVVAGAAKGAAGKAGSAAATAGNAMASGLSKAGSRAAAGIKEAASSVTDSVASIVPDVPVPDTDQAFDAAAEAGSALGHRINSAAAAGRDYSAAIQSRLSESLERQPLLLGAIGLAIGAGIASTFATTAIEGEWVGEKGAAAREKLQGLANDGKDRLQQVMADVRDEADRQGLTPDAAKSAAAEIGEKVKTVAGAARQSATRRFSQSSN